MGMHGYAFFDTPLGRCAIAWSERGIAAVELPGSDDAATRRRIARTLPQAEETTPPADVAAAIDAIVRMLDGEPDDLAALALDMDGVPEFHRKVYDAARAIPPGETRSYGEVAAALGEPGAAQAVGRALGRNPFPIVVPCHRVLAANGALHGFSAPGGIETKRRMLALEGAGAPTLFD
jgi:methylated-DNA-[protein]-cysteine S-methyltransferase